jgi:DNA-binding transcriptional LysR family regulator
VPPTLRLGAVAVALLDPVPLLLEGMAARSDAPSVQVRPMRSAAQAQALRDGVLDLALLHPPLRHPEGLRLRVIGSMALSVVLWSDHPLAGRARLTLDDLTDLDLLLPSAAAAPLLRAQIDRWRAGAPPSAPGTVFDGTAEAVIERVRLRDGVAFMPDALRQQTIAGVVQRPLQGQPLRLEMAVAWRDGETRPQVLALAAMVCQLAEQRRQVSAWLG